MSYKLPTSLHCFVHFGNKDKCKKTTFIKGGFRQCRRKPKWGPPPPPNGRSFPSSIFWRHFSVITVSSTHNITNFFTRRLQQVIPMGPFTYRLLCTSLRSSWSPASPAICQMSSTVSSVSSPQHFWDLRIFCRQTNSLEFTAWSSARSSCWLRTI